MRVLIKFKNYFTENLDKEQKNHRFDTKVTELLKNIAIENCKGLENIFADKTFENENIDVFFVLNIWHECQYISFEINYSYHIFWVLLMNTVSKEFTCNQQNECVKYCFIILNAKYIESIYVENVEKLEKDEWPDVLKDYTAFEQENSLNTENLIEFFWQFVKINKLYKNTETIYYKQIKCFINNRLKDKNDFIDLSEYNKLNKEIVILSLTKLIINNFHSGIFPDQDRQYFNKIFLDSYQRMICLMKDCLITNIPSILENLEMEFFVSLYPSIYTTKIINTKSRDTKEKYELQFTDNELKKFSNKFQDTLHEFVKSLIKAEAKTKQEKSKNKKPKKKDRKLQKQAKKQKQEQEQQLGEQKIKDIIIKCNLDKITAINEENYENLYDIYNEADYDSELKINNELLTNIILLYESESIISDEIKQNCAVFIIANSFFFNELNYNLLKTHIKEPQKIFLTFIISNGYVRDKFFASSEQLLNCYNDNESFMQDMIDHIILCLEKEKEFNLLSCMKNEELKELQYLILKYSFLYPLHNLLIQNIDHNYQNIQAISSLKELLSDLYLEINDIILPCLFNVFLKKILSLQKTYLFFTEERKKRTEILFEEKNDSKNKFFIPLHQEITNRREILQEEKIETEKIHRYSILQEENKEFEKVQYMYKLKQETFKRNEILRKKARDKSNRNIYDYDDVQEFISYTNKSELYPEKRTRSRSSPARMVK